MKKIYTKEELAAIVARTEERLGAHLFYSSAATVQPVVVVAIHPEECRCNACVHVFLEALEKRSAQTLADLQESLGQTPKLEVSDDVNYIG